MVALSVIIAGTIGSYSDLVSKVALYLDRDDLDDRIPDFVALLEARMNRVLRSVNQEKIDTWTFSGQSMVAPGDFRKLRKAFIQGSPDNPLKEVSPQSAAFEYSGEAGTPRAYYLEGRTISLVPPPTAATTSLSVTYWTRIDPLTSDNDSNWLLEEHPDIYLYGTLLEAAVYIRDTDAIGLCSDKLDQSIAELQQSSRNDRYGGGPLAPRVTTQVRGAPC